MDIAAFLTALQRSKKELLKTERATLAERADWCAKLGALLSTKASELPSDENLFSSEFNLNQILKPAARAFLQASVMSRLSTDLSTKAFPAGVIAMGFKSSFGLRLLAEKLAPALLSGNTVLFQPQTAQVTWAAKFAEFVSEAGFPAGSFEVLPADSDLTPFLFQHPGVRAVCWFDPDFQSSLLGSAWIEKKWQIHRGGKTTALVLADANLDEAAAGIVNSIREGWGTATWNPSRIIVIESIEKEFTEKLLAQAAKITAELPAEIKAHKQNWLQKLQAEQARPLNADQAITFLINVSNCTDAHQTELRAPLAFLMSVKYPFDMVKWVNNLPNSVGLQIWGSAEKAAKLIPKMETARIWPGAWMVEGESLFLGVKNSTFGDLDPRPFGGFYSESRFFDE